jgi:uncharacterized protein YdhG (YjbR/CyaY superfamily)
MKTKTPQTIDEYIAGFPPGVQDVLQKIRRTVREAAPDAKETIKYQMPTFMQNGNLVFFAAFKEHIGFYSIPAGTAEFRKAIAPYEGPKGSLRFPLDKPIPFALISQIVSFRVKEHLDKAAAVEKKRIAKSSEPRAR